MRNDPGKGCRIYRLYFNEGDPSDMALRRWIWSLPARKRGHIIKSILRRQLADWGRRNGRRRTRRLGRIKRMGPQRSIRALETPKPIASENDIQSLINRAFAPKTSTP